MIIVSLSKKFFKIVDIFDICFTLRVPANQLEIHPPPLDSVLSGSIIFSSQNRGQIAHQVQLFFSQIRVYKKKATIRSSGVAKIVRW